MRFSASSSELITSWSYCSNNFIILVDSINDTITFNLTNKLFILKNYFIISINHCISWINWNMDFSLDVKWNLGGHLELFSYLLISTQSMHTQLFNCSKTRVSSKLIIRRIDSSYFFYINFKSFKLKFSSKNHCVFIF